MSFGFTVGLCYTCVCNAVQPLLTNVKTTFHTCIFIFLCIKRCYQRDWLTVNIFTAKKTLSAKNRSQMRDNVHGLFPNEKNNVGITMQPTSMLLIFPMFVFKRPWLATDLDSEQEVQLRRERIQLEVGLLLELGEFERGREKEVLLQGRHLHPVSHQPPLSYFGCRNRVRVSFIFFPRPFKMWPCLFALELMKALKFGI